jgi:hypothetical protein
MATQSEIETRITEAEVALHSLITGGGVVEITDADGSRVRYAESDVSKLQSYLSFLQLQLASTASGISRRPITFVF